MIHKRSLWRRTISSIVLLSLLFLPLMVVGQVSTGFCTSTSSQANHYSCNLSPAISAYSLGAQYTFRANSTNTNPATLSLNNLQIVSVVKVVGGVSTPLVANDIRINQVVVVVFDGTNMQMISGLGNVSGGLVDVSSGGTGASSLTAHAVLLGNGTNALQQIACTTANQVWQSGSPGSCTGAPTIGTSVTTPSLIGGTAVGSNITYKSTTGAGTATDIAHQWTGGTDGATVITTMLNNGRVGVGIASSLLGKWHLAESSASTALDAYIQTTGSSSTPTLYISRQTANSGQGVNLFFREGPTNLPSEQNIARLFTTKISGNSQFDYRFTIDSLDQNLNRASIQFENGALEFDATTGNYHDFSIAESSAVRITSARNVGIGTTTGFGTNMTNGLSQVIGVAPSTSPADVFQRWVADTDGVGTAGWWGRDEGNFTYVIGNGSFRLGGTTASFPALTRSAAIMVVQLADLSADATLRALTLRTACVAIASLPTGVTGDRKCVNDQLTSCPVLDGAFTAGGAVICSAFYNGTAWVHS